LSTEFPASYSASIFWFRSYAANHLVFSVLTSVFSVVKFFALCLNQDYQDFMICRIP